MSDAVILIPARLAATRLPGKPMADIHGLPMIVHVWQRATEADLGPVIVAADSAEIIEAVKSAGGTAFLSRHDHASGSDRIAEALASFDPQGRFEIVINVQGDLPTLDPAVLRSALLPLADSGVDITTLCAEITLDEERDNPNVVKLVGSALGERHLRALYFTRATAPWGEGPLYHHIGLYAYRRAALQRFITLAPSPLERREKLEQLRALEAGMRIDAMVVDGVPLGVDTHQDLERARRMLAPASGKNPA